MQTFTDSPWDSPRARPRPIEPKVLEWVTDMCSTHRPRTVEGYVYCLHALVRSGIGDLALLTRDSVSKFLAARRVEGKTPQTCNRNLAAILSFASWLERKGEFPLESLLALRRLRMKQPGPPPPRFLAESEFERLLVASVGVHEQLHLAITLVWYTGLRVGELLALHHGDLVLDATDPYLRVVRDADADGRKPKTGERCVPLAKPLLRELARLGIGSGSRVGPIFPPLRPVKGAGVHQHAYLQKNTIERWLAIARAAAGLDRSTTFIVLRHSFASSMLRTKATTPEKLAKFMGNSVKTCFAHYAGLRGGDPDVDRAFPEKAAPLVVAPLEAHAPPPKVHDETTRVLRT